MIHEWLSSFICWYLRMQKSRVCSYRLIATSFIFPHEGDSVRANNKVSMSHEPLIHRRQLSSLSPALQWRNKMKSEFLFLTSECLLAPGNTDPLSHRNKWIIKIALLISLWICTQFLKVNKKELLALSSPLFCECELFLTESVTVRGRMS